MIESSQKIPKSADRQDIIQYLIDSNFVPNYIKSLEWQENKSLLEDEIQEIWLIILEIPQEIWNKLYQQNPKSIKSYVSGLIYRQIKSYKSSLFKKYKQYEKTFINFSDEVWDIYDQTNIMPKNLVSNNE